MKDSDNVIKQILDEEYDGDIVLVDENDKEFTFNQLAVIPFNDELYCVLKPVTEMEGVGEDDVMVFHILLDDTAETEDEAMENGYLEIEEDDSIADEVFKEYLEMLDSEE